jgi:pyrrolidone-carboxylate peptidase
MKALILLLLTLSTAWAKPIVMISYYDAFNRAPFNSSEKVAKALAQRLNTSETSFEIRLCALNTIFDRAYAQSEDCLKNLPESPVLFLGLGESTCDLKIETMMRNNDRTFGPDNAGNTRSNTASVAGAPAVIGLRYPLPQMFCALNSSEKRSVVLSNNAGSFVCNNTAYQMTNFHPEIQYGFIHVPSNNCRDVANKTEAAIVILNKMIKQAVGVLISNEELEGLPHRNNDIRLSTKKEELKKLRKFYDKNNDCLSDYLKRVKGADEKTGIFGTI